VGTFYYSQDKDAQLWLTDAQTQAVRQMTRSPWYLSCSYLAPTIAWDPSGTDLFISEGGGKSLWTSPQISLSLW
jgi:hypothetical protein